MTAQKTAGTDVVDDFQRYRVADAVQKDVTDKQVRNMLYIVAYDVCCPRRLRKVANVCEDYGIRVEKSVFECDVRPADFESLWLELMDVIDDNEDAIIAYRICGSCANEVESMGCVIRPEKRVAYLI